MRHPGRWLWPSLAALLMVSCGQKDPVRVTVTRTTTIEVRDSLGAPLAGASLQVAVIKSLLVTLAGGTTDSAGALVLHLPDGEGFVGVFPFPMPASMAAGGSFVVPSTGGSDTLLVRLTTHTASTVSGRVLLPGATFNHATTVALPDYPRGSFDVSDSTGHFDLHGIPPGRWRIRYTHDGYRIETRTITVPAPGSQVTAPDLTLTPV